MLFIPKLIYEIGKLRRNQYSSKEKLEEIQNRKLRNIIEHAYRNVPYYHNLFKTAKITPSDIRKKDDLKKIPITTKEDIRNNYPHKMIAKDVDMQRCRVHYTSGSTGMPTAVPQDETDFLLSLAFFYYAFFECGVKLTDITADMRIFKTPQKKHWFEKLGIMRTDKISIDQPVYNIVERLRNIHPDCLYAHPSTISIIMDYINENKIEGISPRLVFTQGETLSAHYRRYITETFGVNTNNTYGSAEFWRLAFECNEHRGLHMISNAAIIELIKNKEDAYPEGSGEIVVTGLYNHAMPLIRYSLDDIGIATDEECSCGRTYPLIKDIIGRKNDIITLPSGRKISWVLINVQLFEIPRITYRVTQLKRDKFLVELAKNKWLSKKTIDEVKKAVVRGCLGEKVNVDVDVVKEIPRDKSDKTRIIISKVTN
jgi:phenylacetate-CoA ligase